MDFLFTLEKIRTPFLNALFNYITYFGSEFLFILFGLIIFWCVSKKDGYYVMTVGFVGLYLNQLMKLIFQIPRPWLLDSDFSIVESARADATGYSFPSGHTQSITGTLGSVARFTRRRWLRITCIIIIALTAFSRMYLGVHTPLDVGVSLLIGLALVFALYPLFRREPSKKTMYIILFSMLILSVVYVVFAENHSWPYDMDADNLYEGTKSAYLMLGCSAGVLLSYFLDERFIHFSVTAPLGLQIIKVAVGGLLVFVIKLVLKAPLAALLGDLPGSAVRYFIIVIFAMAGWPSLFKFISPSKTR